MQTRDIWDEGVRIYSIVKLLETNTWIMQTD